MLMDSECDYGFASLFTEVPHVLDDVNLTSFISKKQEGAFAQQCEQDEHLPCVRRLPIFTDSLEFARRNT